MLDSLEQRTGTRPGSTVVVDRGMASPDTLDQIRARGMHYLVAGRQSERTPWWEAFEQDDDWDEVIRTPSPRNPAQRKSRVQIKRRQQGQEVYILCRSEGREAKDRAIREKVVTVVLRTTDGKILKIRKGTTPEPPHREIYSTLQIPLEVMRPVKTWHEPSPHSD